MQKILVAGAGGQLGQCLKIVAEQKGITDVVFLTAQQANILDVEHLNELFEQENPKYIINCAAYTAVDQAEDDGHLAKAINETGAANLAKVCKDHGTILIHISTDFVFGGNEVKLLTEKDQANPINIYGQTKLDGELQIASILKSHFIIRTSWLYSAYANNFVKTMLKLSAERAELNVITDQIGAPTYAIDLAHVIFDVIQSENKNYGLYHYSNEGVASWFDFAKAIFEIAGNFKVQVNPIPSSAFATRAKRPAFSVMDKSKIKSTFNLAIPYWRTSLVECIKQINKF